MKFNSQSIAKTVLLLSLGIGSISAWYGWKTSQEVPAVTRQKMQTQKKANDANLARAELESLPSAEASLSNLDTAFSVFMLDMMNSRVRYGIDITQASPSKPGGNEKVPVAQLAEDLPGTTVKSLKVQLQGNYSDYDRFVQFLEHVRKVRGASVVHLKIKDNTYSLSVRIHGKS